MNIRTIGRLLPGIILPAALGLFLLLLAGWTRPGHGPSTIIISEVAWGGTAANSADEWLELHNPGPTPIDLTGWHLQDGDGGLDILLNGSIPAGGFFLLERSDDNTISDIPADQIYTGSLSNSGETLTLRDTADQVIDTANNDGGGWPAGSGSPNYLSMERLGPTLPDSDTNWVGNNTVIRNGLDANGNPINGTPSQPNAAWQSSSTGDVLLDAVLYDGYTSGDSDEAIQLRNMIPNTITLAGWQLSDGTTTALFPAGAQLPPYATAWVTGDAAAFQQQFGHPPDITLASWPGFANSGDEVILRNSVNTLIDVLIYKAGDTGQPGWNGPALEPYLVSGVFAEEGQILYRLRDPLTGQIVPDTDTAADWAQMRDDVINGRKVRYPGWDLDPFFFTARITQTANLTVAIAPDNAYQAVVNQINSAQDSLLIETLTFENAALAQALAAAAGRGVAITVLLEGSPAGGLPDQERWVCQTIETAGGACWFMISDDALNIHDRYRFLHAKFILIDGQRALISSENLSPNSLPNDDKSDGTWGRRGVILITDAPGVVSHLQALWAADFNPAGHNDLFRWQAGHDTYGAPPAGFVPITITGGTTYTVRYATPLHVHGQLPLEIVQSPENSLRAPDSLLGLVARAAAGDTVLVQQLSERPYWGSSSSNPTDDPNPRLEAYLAAARRGATVRLLLDAYFDDGSSPTSNRATCEYVNAIALAEQLALECRLGNPAGLGIHNKMVLVEAAGQGWLHVGSLNGTEQSSKGNRELALQVQSNAAYALLAGMFDRDWPYSLYLPLIQNTTGRAYYPLISELLYDPFGTDEAEYIELANPTQGTLDISGWLIGDAVYPTDFEDVRQFPAGTLLPPGSTLVIATTATGFFAAFGHNPDFEIVDTDPAVPDLPDFPLWGDPAALLQLGNAGDEVLLRDPAGVVIDVVTYGSGSFPGVISCNLVTAANHSLERYPYWLDTNDCTTDFRDWPFPNPGSLP